MMKFIHIRFAAAIFIFLLVLIFAPRTTEAEIATVRDWIGLFSYASQGTQNRCLANDTVADCRAKTVGGTRWVYTSSCTQIAGTIPSLANRNGCNFTLPAENGTYQLRMYANDKGNEGGDPDESAFLAESKVITVGSGGASTTAATGKIYNITPNSTSPGDLTINNNITVNVTGVIFVEGKLTINENLTNPNKNTGLVFVVKGNVLIDKSVTEIDAVIISSGTIYTATDRSTGTTACIKNSVNVGANTNALVVKGSLVTIYKDQNQQQQCTSGNPPSTCPIITFCRTLTDTRQPAEIVESQPKYLVILKNLYSETIQKWSELADAPAATSPCAGGAVCDAWSTASINTCFQNQRRNCTKTLLNESSSCTQNSYVEYESIPNCSNKNDPCSGGHCL